MNIINIINEFNGNDSIYQLKAYFIDTLKGENRDKYRHFELLDELHGNVSATHKAIAFIMAYKDLDISSIKGDNLNQLNRSELTGLASIHRELIEKELKDEASRLITELVDDTTILEQLKDKHSEVSQLVNAIVEFHMMQNQLLKKVKDLNEIQCDNLMYPPQAFVVRRVETENTEINKAVEIKQKTRVYTSNKNPLEERLGTSRERTNVSNKQLADEIVAIKQAAGGSNLNANLNINKDIVHFAVSENNGYSADNSNLGSSESDTEGSEIDSLIDPTKGTENGSETTESKSYLSRLAGLLPSFLSGSNKQVNNQPAANQIGADEFYHYDIYEDNNESASSNPTHQGRTQSEQRVMTFGPSIKSIDLLEAVPAFKQLQSKQKAEYTVIRKQLRELRKERNTKIAEFSANDVKRIRNQIEALKDTDLAQVVNQLNKLNDNSEAKTINIVRTAAKSNDGKNTQYDFVELKKASDLENTAIGYDTTGIEPAPGERLAAAYERLHIVYQTIDGSSDGSNTIEIPIGYYVNLKFDGKGHTTKFIPLDDDFEKVSNHFRVGAVSPLEGIMYNNSIHNEYTIRTIYYYRWAKESYINLRDHKSIGYIIQGLESLIYWPLYGVGYVIYLIGKLIMNSVIGLYKLVREFFSNQYVQSTLKFIAIIILGLIAAAFACAGLGLGTVAVAACAVVALACIPFYIGYRWFYEGRFYEDMNTVGAFMFEVELALFVVVASVVLAALSSLKFGVWTAIAAIALVLMIAGVVLEFIFSTGINLYYSKANERHMWVTGVMSTIDKVKDSKKETSKEDTIQDLEKTYDEAEANKPSNKMYNKLFGVLTSSVNLFRNIIVDLVNAFIESCSDVKRILSTGNWKSSYQQVDDNDSHVVETVNTRHYDDYLRKGIANGQEEGIGNARAHVTSFNGAACSLVSSSVSSVSSLFSSKQSGDADILEPLLENTPGSDHSGTPANSNEPESPRESFDSGRNTPTVNPIHGNGGSN